MRLRSSIFIVATVCSACALPPSEYYSETLTGRIVDRETKAPVAGASVLVQWPLQGGLEGHIIGTLHIEEAVTNENGEYRIAAWGPVARPTEGILDAYDPDIFIFKPDYIPLLVSNGTVLQGGSPAALPEGYGRHSSIRISVWNRKTIGLEPFHGPLSEYARILYPILGTATYYPFWDKRCLWKGIPRLIRAIDTEMQRERSAGAVGDALATSFTLSARLRQEQCAPFDSFLKAYEER